MLSCCNDLITTISLEENFSSHEDFDELNPSKLARTLDKIRFIADTLPNFAKARAMKLIQKKHVLTTSYLKLMRQLEDLNLKPSILKHQCSKEF